MTLANFEILEGEVLADGTSNTGHVHFYVDGEFFVRIDGAVAFCGLKSCWLTLSDSFAQECEVWLQFLR